MSIKDRLARKTQDLVMPMKGEALTASIPVRTGPGQMLMVNSLMKESNEKLAVLEQRLRQFEGGLPVRLLEPGQVIASKWANRVEASFDGSAFAGLKREIAEASGNVQPIKVRPLTAASGTQEQFEIIFGHRRHRACAELGLPVLALIDEVSDAELFKQMDRENRARADLSPWEQGRMYRQALQERLFGSREQLSRELGIDPGNLSKALRLAELDETIVAAFGSPLDLQYRWAKPLADAFSQDKDRVIGLAREFALSRPHGKPAKFVFDALIENVPPVVRIEQVRVGRKLFAEIRVEGDRVSVLFEKGVVDSVGLAGLRDLIAGHFSE